MLFFLSVLLSAACGSAAQGAWEETTVVPVRLDPTGTESLSPEALVYRLDAFGTQVVLELEPDRSFLAPGFVFQEVGHAEERREPEGADQDRCFYSGSVRGASGSSAALNACDGLRGAFYFSGQEYFIQPTAKNASHQDPHLLRRRSRAGGSGSKCGVNEEEEKIPERRGTRSEQESVSTGSQGKQPHQIHAFFSGRHFISPKGSFHNASCHISLFQHLS